jgi:hypothetical protein
MNCRQLVFHTTVPQADDNISQDWVAMTSQADDNISQDWVAMTSQADDNISQDWVAMTSQRRAMQTTLRK